MITRRSFLAASAAAPFARAAEAPRFLGVTVMPEYIQSEGIDGVLRSLERVRATAVCTSPYVMEPASEDAGSREPPADAGAGGVRLLDRPLWGKRELYVRTAPSFTPDTRLYQGLRYQPVAPDALSRQSGAVVGDFVKAAKAAGLEVYLQFQAAIPPGYRVQFGGGAGDDEPRLPDGSVPARRVDKNGSLASEHIRAYSQALIADLCRAYPGIDGLRPDWPEYPPYLLDSLFLDFRAPARRAAERLGYSPEAMQRQALAAWKQLHGSLTNQHMELLLSEDGGRYGLASLLSQWPGFTDLCRFKAVLVDELLGGFRAALTKAGGAEKKLVPNAFPPPFTTVSGLDFQKVAVHSSAISVKLYTMHWPMMLRFYGDALLKANPGLSSQLLAAVLVRLMDIDERPLEAVESYSYPEPDVPHPVSPQSLDRKIRQARLATGSAVAVNALAHGYGPVEDFEARLRVAWQASGGRVWINRYGYLSDEKLERIRQVCGTSG
ncbi:MAG: hypothetical protein KIT83_02445 [Bryobacterales bacterium]|nr:hypothetical protein [Bryobacterales bacterium]